VRIFAFVDAQKADFPVRTHVVAANREIVESAIDSRWHPDGWHVSAESYRPFLPPRLPLPARRPRDPPVPRRRAIP
jgi:hypothetical protein